MEPKTEFTILQADVILSSVTEDKKTIDISNNIIELTFYENLFKPYVDCRMVMIDDFGFRNSLSVQGTERIRLVVGTGKEPEKPCFVKYFFVSRIVDTRKQNEKSELLSIELVEEHVYINAIKQVNRSFESTIEDMITNIFDKDLGVSVIKSFFKNTAQGIRKVIVPYLSPLEAVNWLKDRATTQTGSPIFVYGDLYSDQVYISDLDNLLKEDIINEDAPFRYSESMAAIDATDEHLRPYFEITNFKELEAENALALYEEGAIGSYYATVDASTGLVRGAHVSVRNILTEMYVNGLIDNSSEQSVFDPSLEIDGKLSDEYNSLYIHQVTSSNTYNQFKSYHDETVVYDDEGTLLDLSESKLKVKNKIIRQILKKNQIDITMSGIGFFEGRTSVGRRLRLIFLNPDTSSQKKDTKSLIDKKKSGDYLLLAIRHNLANQKHYATLRLTKLSDLPANVKL